MSDNQVTVHNVADTIREKVKSFMLEAIPANQFDELIKKEWDGFFVPPEHHNNWEERKPSKFAAIVQEAIKKEMETKINESVRIELQNWLNAKGSTWSSTGQKVVETTVRGYAPIFLESLANEAATRCLSNMAGQQGLYPR